MARQIELNMMGQPTMSWSVSGVLKEIRLVKENRDGELKRLKQRLLKSLNDGGEK
jgi:hypothetical protein